MENNYVVYHLHSDLGNGIMMDSASKYKEYIRLAKENNMKAIAFSEHGSLFNWIYKKMDCDTAEIKYIHGQEFYMTTTLEEKVRETFHIGLYARNWEGVKEINKLSSVAYNKEDNHFYYRPRISMQEIMNTSNNVIITTACLASILWAKKDEEVTNKFIEWMSKNSERCFLEIQYHKNEEQVAFNKYLYELSKKHNIRLIAGTDTHAATKEDFELRSILQKSKKIVFSQEDEFDLTFKNYEELIKMFKNQKSLPENVYLEAIQNTNVFADMVEDFKLDTSHKYPKISDNAKKDLQERINVGIIKRKVNKWNKEKKQLYYDRIKEEFEVFEKLNMLDYILLLDNIIIFCRENNIDYAPRGSCNGSLILWALEVTDIDSIKFDLPFFRFANPERVSLGDVDIDMSNAKRPLVKDFLYNYKGIQGSAIITYQTYALRGSVKAVGRGLGIPLPEIELVSADIDEIIEEDEKGEEKKITTFHNKEMWEKRYPELFKWVYKCIGLIENTSVHACGFVATDRNIDEEIGTYRTDDCKWVISQNNMKCIDAVNFVKMDFLVVDNVQIIGDTCRLAEIPLLKNDEMDFEDDKVWQEMLVSGLGIFQFEKTGWRHLKHTLENFLKFKKFAPNISRLDVMTALNGIIRPVGDSIRDNFIQGVPYESGMKEIDTFLSSTLGYLIYQEQIMTWLNEFCGYSKGQSDIVRRAIAKKGGTEKLTPEIRLKFIENCTKKYPHYSKKHIESVADKFIQVIIDASDYGFSINHSNPYTILGYKGAYLRHYYPLEFLTIQLNINQSKLEKTVKISEYINKFTKIQIKPPQFRFSKSEYTCDKQTNTIYKGMESIKYLSSNASEELFLLKNNQYNNFIELLKDINTKTSCNSRQLNILINLNFFSEFGKNKKLNKINEYFNIFDNKKQFKKEAIKELGIDENIIIKNTGKITDKIYKDINTDLILSELCKDIPNESISVKEQMEFELEYLGYFQSTFDYDRNFAIVYDINTKYSPKIKVRFLASGREETYKIYKKEFNINPLFDFDVIKIIETTKKNKSQKVNDEWKKIENEYDDWLIKYYKVKGEVAI